MTEHIVIINPHVKSLLDQSLLDFEGICYQDSIGLQWGQCSEDAILQDLEGMVNMNMSKIDHIIYER